MRNAIEWNHLNKLILLKRSSFLRRDALLVLYFQLILPSVLYRLVVWGGCVNMEQLNSLEKLHRRAARIISYNVPRDMQPADVYWHSKWNTLNYLYKLRLISYFTKYSAEKHQLLYLT